MSLRTFAAGLLGLVMLGAVLVMCTEAPEIPRSEARL